jgi:hypothetical protein
METDSALEALAILRDGSQFQWYVIPLFALVFYVYAVEVERRNWNLVFAGLAFWGMDWFNEIWNSLVFHFTDFAPVWGAPAKTAYLILIGLNIEICFMFAIAGITFGKMLPADKKLRIWGIPNRLLIAIGGSALVGYLPFFLVSFWVHDMESVKKKLSVLGVIYGVDIVSILVFGVILGWI